VGTFVEVYAQASVDECARRDVKGLYEKAFKAGLNNTVTAKDLLICLRALLPGEKDSPFSAASRDRMLDILKAQEFNEKIPAGLPKGTSVAHKTGDITGVHHDAASVFPPGKSPYVLVVLTSGIAEWWSLTMDERKKLVEIAVEEGRAANGRIA